MADDKQKKSSHEQNNKTILNLIRQTMSLPAVRIDREKFLRRELSRQLPKSTVEYAVRHNPAQAGIGRAVIDRIAKKCISRETGKVSTASFAAGLPGGILSIAAMPLDLAQDYVFVLRIIQKLAYLYGFPDFHMNDVEMHREVENELLVFLGVMYNVKEANALIQKLAEAAAAQAVSGYAAKVLSRTAVYRILERSAGKIGLRLTEETFTKGVTKAIPVIGGIASGALTYATFRRSCSRLMNTLKEFPLADPSFYSLRDGDVIIVEDYQETHSEEINESGEENETE